MNYNDMEHFKQVLYDWRDTHLKPVAPMHILLREHNSKDIALHVTIQLGPNPPVPFLNLTWLTVRRGTRMGGNLIGTMATYVSETMRREDLEMCRWN
jgi:hypothetical protein